MPRKINSSPPPEVMAWGKAAPVLVVAAIFDALRFMFEWFIFFGPAMAGLYCTIKGSDTVIGSLVGTPAVGTVCAAGAGIVGFFGAGVIEPFGMVMAMATGFAGWLAIGLYLVTKNARIFKENALWFGGSLLLSEIPFIGSLPAFTFTVWKMYRTQIRIEKVAFAKWKKETASAQLQERNQQTEQIMQEQATQQAQIQQEQLQQEALNQEWGSQMVQQEEQQAMNEEAATETGVQPPDAPMTTTTSPRLVAVPNYAGPNKNSNTKNKGIPEEVREAA